MIPYTTGLGLRDRICAKGAHAKKSKGLTPNGPRVRGNHCGWIDISHAIVRTKGPHLRRRSPALKNIRALRQKGLGLKGSLFPSLFVHWPLQIYKTAKLQSYIKISNENDSIQHDRNKFTKLQSCKVARNIMFLSGPVQIYKAAKLQSCKK